MENQSRKSLFLKVGDFFTTHFVAMTGYIFFKVLCKGEIYNSVVINKTLNDHRRFIIAMNHESYLDWIIIWAIFKYKYRVSVIFLAKEKLFRHRLWGKIMRHAKCIRVSDEGSKIIDKEGKKMLEESIIGIFPEGTRSRDGNLLEFKSGVAVLCAKQRIPILPISLNGFYEAWKPNSSYPSVSKMEIVVNPLIEYREELGVRDYLQNTKNAISLGKKASSIKSRNIENAIFDLDSTLFITNIAGLLFFMKRKRKSTLGYIVWLLRIAPLAPLLKIIDIFYRPLTQLVVFGMYNNFEEDEILEDCKEYLTLNLDSKKIEKTNKLLNILKKNGTKIILISTNQELFVKFVARKLEVDGVGISLKHLRQLKFSEKLQYLANFKRNEISKTNLNDYIGVGDSKYDMPIFEKSSYSILVNRKKRKSKLISKVNNYIKI